MGIQINGQTDTISAADGGLVVSGYDLDNPANLVVSGIITATTFSGNIIGTTATFSGNVSVGGTITYEDVTNVDSIGIVTARSGIVLTGGDVTLGTGVTVSGASANTFTLSTNGSERLNIDSSGNVNIDSGGVYYDNANNRLGIGTTTVDFSQFGSNTGGVAIADVGATNTGLKISDGSYHNYLVQAGNGNFYISHYGAGDTVFSNGTSGEEAFRVDASRRLLVGTSSALSGNAHTFYNANAETTLLLTKDNANPAILVCAMYHTATAGNNKFLNFYTESSPTERGGIDYNRSAGQVRYNITSDRRLKSNIQDSESALNILNRIKVRSYVWTETGYNISHGFIAQELNEAVPDAVKVGDDGDEVVDAWAVDNAKIVPLLTKVLQEAMDHIETLEASNADLLARVTALEAQ